MNFADIEAFVALAETGSINRAALRLNLTQPATTRRLQNFEAAVGGAALLDRRIKPPILTPAGQQVLAHCRRVLKAVAELQASATTSASPTGDLRIGIAHGLGDIVLSSPLEELGRNFPQIRLRITSNWTARLIEGVRNGALDCAIGFLTKEYVLPLDMHAHTIGMEQIEVVAGRNALSHVKNARSSHLTDFADKVWVLNPPGCGCRTALQLAFDRAKRPLQIGAEVFGEDLQLSFIAHNGGFGLVPRRVLDHSSHGQLLQLIKIADFNLEMAVTLLHGPSLGSLQSVLDWLQQRVALAFKDNK